MKEDKKEKPEFEVCEYPIRVYTKEELAMLYNPTQCVTVALNTLSRWIRMNRPLMQELEAVGYNKFRHSFTPREIDIIFRYIGEPGA